MRLNKKMTLEQFAIAVASELKKHDIEVVLTGGAVVAIYSTGKYVSKDADFLSATDHKTIMQVMHTLGFKNVGKDFYHWRDRQSLDQALLVAQNHPVKIKKIEEWSKSEGEISKFEEFKSRLNQLRTQSRDK